MKQGKCFFVRQTFKRGFDHFDEGVKGYFIFSHYDNLVTAQDHFGAITHDRNRFLYDWYNPDHQERLQKAANMQKEYKVYSAVFKKDWKRGITTKMQQKVREYVSKLGWNPKGGEMVDTAFELRFGELFIVLKYRGRQAKVKFEEIEKIL